MDKTLFVNRAMNLIGADRTLAMGVHRDKKDIAEVAKAAGMSTASARKRLDLLERTLLGEVADFVATNYRGWDTDETVVAPLYFIGQQSFQSIVTSTGMSLHRVRTAVNRIEGILMGKGINYKATETAKGGD